MNFSQNIDYVALGNAVYSFNKNKKYKYILFDSLNSDEKDKIIKLLEDKNGNPKNFLNFVYEANLDKIKAIHKEQLNELDLNSNYSANLDDIEDYDINKFGIAIKVNADKEYEKQLVFYCLKNQALYEQFFLNEALISEKYNAHNLEVSLTDSKISKSQQGNQNNQQGSQNEQNAQQGNQNNHPAKAKSQKGDKNEIKENSIKSESTGNKSNNDFKDEMKIDEFIKGNIFESEANSYLRRKLFQEEGNEELPNVFYAIKKSVGNKFFYNELDCVFKVNNSIKFDENIVRINCKYEKGQYGNSKKDNRNFFEIVGKNLVFVEFKFSGDFCDKFEKLFKKIYTFRSLLDNIFKTQEYGTKILYLYDNEFINKNVCFPRFCSTVKKAMNNCVEKGMTDVQNYDLFAFHMNNNVYIYNYSNIDTELKKLKVQQNTDRLELQNTKNELKDTKGELKDTKKELKDTKGELEKLKSQMRLLFEKFDLKDFGDNITVKKSEKSGDIIIMKNGAKNVNNTVEIENQNKDVIIKDEDLPNLNPLKGESDAEIFVKDNNSKFN